MSEENVEIVISAYRTFSEGNLTALLQHFDPEVVSYTAFPLPDPVEHRGHEGFLQWTADWTNSFDEFTMEIETRIDAGDAVVLGVTQRATGAASGVPVEQTFWFAHVLGGGRITRIGIHATREEALEAVGLAE